MMMMMIIIYIYICVPTYDDNCIIYFAHANKIGLHRREATKCNLPPTLRRSLEQEKLPQGAVPHLRASR